MTETPVNDPQTLVMLAAESLPQPCQIVEGWVGDNGYDILVIDAHGDAYIATASGDVVDGCDVLRTVGRS
jgi:hypothetical protein